MPDFELLMNELGRKKIPFLFVFDYKLKTPFVLKLSEIDNKKILFNINGKTNSQHKTINKNLEIKISPVEKDRYCKAFDKVMKGILHGDSFLLNLTMPSGIEMNYTLEEIFHSVKAKYKLFFKNVFTVFSPEPFVKIENGVISSFPMKGTIDASIPGAENKLLSNPKELAEHYTIVDLIRNDLSIVAKNVAVKRFRYIEKINTHYGELLQMSSEITGELDKNYHEKLGTIFKKILPAGSISGAPKKRTLEIIDEAEKYDRGFYTGVTGIFNGENVDSGVMIRFIEKNNGKYIYKSGGGITARSNCQVEYQELIKKVYVPVA